MSENIVIDAKGRKIVTRDLNVLQQIKLLRAIGAEQSNNQPYVRMVMMAASVVSIDDIPRPLPTNEMQIDGAIGSIGDEGFAALMVDMQRKAEAMMAAAEAAADGEAKPVDPLAQSA